MWRQHTSTAFTLIELLVVISIISVLVAILLPVLCLASQRIQCSNNSSPGWKARYVSYGYNYRHIATSIGYASPSPVTSVHWATPARTVDIAKPTATIIMADTLRANNSSVSTPMTGWHQLWDRLGSDTGIPDDRHQGSVNVSWADGHGTTVRSPDPEDYTAVYDAPEFRPGYFADNNWDRY